MGVRKWRTNSALWGTFKPAARSMRHNPTAAEVVLWRLLKRGQLEGLSFRRQHPVGRFIVDFYCAQLRLVVEVDGGIHAALHDRDAERDQALHAMGCSVLRVSNDEVLRTPEAVLQRIRNHAATSR